MPPFFLATFGYAITGATICGIKVRHRRHEVFFFTMYLATMIVTDLLIGVFPEVFWKRVPFLAKEVVLHVVACCVAIELGRAATRQAPRARRLLMVSIAVISAVGLGFATAFLPSATSDIVVGAAMPTLYASAALLFAVVLAVSSWFGLPMRAFSRSIAFLMCLDHIVLATVYSLWWVRWSNSPKAPDSLASYASLGLFGVYSYYAISIIWLAGSWTRGKPNADEIADAAQHSVGTQGPWATFMWPAAASKPNQPDVSDADVLPEI